MKKQFKKVSLFAVVMLMQVKYTFASNGIFGDGVNTLLSEVEAVFPYLAGLGFLVTTAMNLGNLQGENRDMKKFFTNLGIYVLGLLIVSAIYAWIKGYSL